MAPSGAQTGPREYLESVGEKGEKVNKGDNWKIGQVGDKITITVETSSPSNSTDQGFLFDSDMSPGSANLISICPFIIVQSLFVRSSQSQGALRENSEQSESTQSFQRLP